MSSDGAHRKKAEELAAKKMIAESILMSAMGDKSAMPCCAVGRHVVEELAELILHKQDTIMRNTLAVREMLPEGTCLDVSAQWLMVFTLESQLGFIEMAMRMDEIPSDDVMEVFVARFAGIPSEWPDVPQDRILNIRRRYDEILAMWHEWKASNVNRTDEARRAARARKGQHDDDHSVDLSDDAKAKLEALRARIAESREATGA